MKQKYTDEEIINWIKNAQSLGGEIISDIFCIYLESTIKNNWVGACHDLSASFYMTLLEYGFQPKLCIGVVEVDEFKFDHSWISMDEKIYDFSICNQNVKSHPPIFSSTNLENLSESNIIYGVRGARLVEPARGISELSLDEYQNIRPKNHKCIYSIAAEFGEIIGVESRRELDEETIKNKYSTHKRSLIN